VGATTAPSCCGQERICSTPGGAVRCRQNDVHLAAGHRSQQRLTVTRANVETDARIVGQHRLHHARHQALGTRVRDTQADVAAPQCSQRLDLRYGLFEVAL
jgi:hypothetical protein